MRRYIPLTALAVLLSAAAIHASSLTAYGLYWHGLGDGGGMGIKLKDGLSTMTAIDVRLSVVHFDHEDLRVYPFESSLMFRFPLRIEPYVMLGGGYYPTDNHSVWDDGFGWFSGGGIEFKGKRFGVVFETRYMDLEEDISDGFSSSLGVIFRL